MSTEYFIKKPNRPPVCIGVVAGKNGMPVMSWRVAPHEVITNSHNSIIVAETGTEFSVIDFFSHVVRWPEVAWEISAAVNDKFQPRA